MKVKKSKYLNVDAVIKIILLLGFSLFFFLAIQSGKVSMYVHPRNIPYIGFAAAAMLLIALFFVPEVFKPQKTKANVMPLMFFIVPLVMAFALLSQSLDSSSLAYGEMKLENTEGNTAKGNSDSVNSANSGSANSNSGNGNAVESNGLALELKNDTIIMDNSNFVRWIQEIYDNTDKYEDKKIEVTGFVYKDEQFKNNEFVPARMMMVCCAADMQLIGLLCRYDDTAVLEEETWVRVTGTIGKDQFNGSTIPIINAIHVIKTGKPKEDYVYPY